MPDSCQPYSAVDFNHTDCKKKVLLLGSRAHLVFYYLNKHNELKMNFYGNGSFATVFLQNEPRSGDQRGQRNIVKNSL